ncbi:hypothetical protein [Spirosoma arcticum]
MNRYLVTLFITTLLITGAVAQPVASSAPDPYAYRWTVGAGLAQPLIGGGVNVMGTYFTRRFTFEYSHGMFLRYQNSFSTDKQIASIYALYSTGLGVGYRLTRYLDIRAEAKNHRFTAQLNTTQSVTYTNSDVGAGAYYRIYPFNRRNGWASGLVIEPSVRYWQYVYSTLPGGRISYLTNNGNPAVHRPYNFGLFGNISIGYTFRTLIR